MFKFKRIDKKDIEFWHYTTYPAFLNILDDRKIKRASIGASLGLSKGPKVVWFSTNPVWEEAVRKTIDSRGAEENSGTLTRNELFMKGYFPVRLKTDMELVQLISWRKAKRKLKVKREIIRDLEDTADMWGAKTSEWWVSFNAVALDKILLPIEIWNGITWVDIEIFDFH